MMTDIIYKKTLFVIFLVCTMLLTGCNKQTLEGKKINLVFRLDDYSTRSSTDMELRIIDVFRKNKISITFGVIPFIISGDEHDPSPQDIIPLTSTKGDILKTGIKDGILEIALHGYSHQTINTEKYTEFSGIEYESQVKKIYKGKEFLEGITAVRLRTE